jgi:hypothetical protein
MALNGRIPNEAINQWNNYSILFSSAAEELAQYHGTILCHHSPDNLDPVIKAGVIKYRQRRTTCARFGIDCPENDAPKPRLDDGSGAHRTRLDCNIQGAVVQAVVPQLLGGPAQSKDFGVSGRIVEVDGPIVRPRQHAPVLDNECPNRNLILAQSALSLAQGQTHEL